MNNSRWSALMIVLFISLTISAPYLYCEELTGQTLYQNNRDKICDIDTTVHFKDGTTKTKGGSGFFVDKEGHVLTSAHVVKLELAPKITKKQLDSIKKYTYWVILPSKNRKYRAKLAGSNDYADMALLKVQDIDPKDYSVVKIGDPSKVRIGDRTWAIGNPNNLANSLTSGIVSALHRNIGMHFIDDFIQTDCPINHGNSGCPVFNDREEVIGVANSIYPNRDGLAFAQPMSLAKIDALKRGNIDLPTAGFETMLENFPRDGENRDSPGSDDLKQIEKITEIEYIGDKIAIAKESWGSHSAIVTSIDEFEDPNAKEKKPSAAKKSGIEKGDIIVSIDNTQISRGMDIRIFLVDKKAGDKIQIVLRRSERGKMVEKKIELTLTKRVNPSDASKDSDDEDDDEEEDASRAQNKKHK